MTEFVTPTGAKYSLSHLAPSTHFFGVTLDKQAYDLPVRVMYRDHCYTRSFVSGSDDPKFLFIPCVGEQRVFCPDRWAYSCGLPGIIENLLRQNAQCYCATQDGLYFKIDSSTVNRSVAPHAGWYLFFKFRPYRSGPGVVLSVESNHERTSWPSNARGRKPARFRVLLTEYLRKRRDLLKGLCAKA
ncbi:hypothetical protein [Pseudomonas sp. RC10]|uniref:hypothetical protein n=1 Tax=Pseudomonas bambusae TaxID=3139142 RepID=UPI00313871A2